MLMLCNKNMTREEKLTRFIKRLEEDENTLAVILFGSQARGNRGLIVI